MIPVTQRPRRGASSRGQILREFIGTEAPKEMQLAAAAGAVQIFREAHSQKGWVCTLRFYFSPAPDTRWHMLENVRPAQASCACPNDT